MFAFNFWFLNPKTLAIECAIQKSSTKQFSQYFQMFELHTHIVKSKDLTDKMIMQLDRSLHNKFQRGS